jgi:membrane protease YdiL (CAAX protease family)
MGFLGLLSIARVSWAQGDAAIAVSGPAEKYIFRGFVYGGLLNLFKGCHWLFLAFISSVLFALVHLYYAAVYGIASIIPFIDIVAIAMALSITYYLSGGNRLIPALIHGAFDATGFLAVAVSPKVGLSLRGLLTLSGLVLAVMLARRHAGKKVENG